MSLLFYEKKFPTLELDEQYILREQTLEDTEDFFHYYTDPEVGKYILASKPATLLEASSEVQYCRNLFYTQRGIYWTIANKNNNHMIGAIGLYINNAHFRGEITYDLSRTHWRQGIMQKAIHIVIHHAFEQMQLLRIEAIIHQKNIPSIQLLKKLEFTHEGTLKNYRYFDGKIWDIEMFATIPKIV